MIDEELISKTVLATSKMDGVVVEVFYKYGEVVQLSVYDKFGGVKINSIEDLHGFMSDYPDENRNKND